VPADLVPLVFLPIAMGGLAPPDELVEQLLGPKPPDEPVALPPEPVLDESQLPPEDAPAKPGILPYDEELAYQWRWEQIDDEKWEAHKVEVDAENASRLAAYEQELAEYEGRHPLLEEAKRQHQAALKAWEQEVERIKAENSTLEQRRSEYGDQKERIVQDAYGLVGAFLGDMRQASLAGINGHPMFFSVQIIHKEDWSRLWKAWKAEQDRLKNLEI
jgi:hypothetical protein